MQAIKEKAANVAASAKSGMEKTKAVVGEKVIILCLSYTICLLNLLFLFSRCVLFK